MHIAIIRHSIRNRGGDKLTLDYAQYLVSQGNTIDYWTNEVASHFTIDKKINIKRIPWLGVGGTLLFTFLNKFSYGIIIVDLVVMAFIASLRNKKALIYLAQDYDVTYHKSIIIKKFIHFCYQFVLNTFATPTISVANGLSDKLSIYQPKRLKTVSNGVDTKLFFRDPQTAYLKDRQKK